MEGGGNQVELNRQTMKKTYAADYLHSRIAGGASAFGYFNFHFLTIIGMIQPLLAGICIAYILNVPMRAIENALFVRASGPKRERQSNHTYDTASSFPVVGHPCSDRHPAYCHFYRRT